MRAARMRLLQGLIRRYLKRAESLDSAGLPPTLPRVFAYPSRERERESPRYFILLTGTAGDGERQLLPSLLSPKRGRCNLSRNHFYRSVISSPKARTRLRPYSVVGVLVPLRFALPEKRQVRGRPWQKCCLSFAARVPSITPRCNLLYLPKHVSRYF